jgi:flagellar protein FlaG
MDIQSIGNITTPAPAQIDGNAAPPAPKAAAPVQTVDAVRQAATVPSMEQLSEAVKNINKALETRSQGVEFSLDSDTEKVLVKVVDQATGKVLRQMPSEEALQIAKALDEAMDKLQGVLIKQKA